MRAAFALMVTVGAFLMSVASASAARTGPSDGVGREAEPSASPGDAAVYVVEISGEPLATYAGGSAGPATGPEFTGAARLDTSSPAARAYAAHLTRAQDRALRAIAAITGRPTEPVHRYRNVLNGFAVRLTADEARAVAGMPGVAHVTKSFRLRAHTDSGPGWIGAPGIWDGSAVPGGQGSMGEGVIVGVLDTGINMDHPSFAAVGHDGYAHENPLGDGVYRGFCDPEHPLHDPTRWQCNAKLIGAWSWPSAGNDPEDDGGHGTHTASTSAGNVLDATIVAPTVAITLPLSGVAPHANIISYDMATGGWATIETMAAAVDQSVEDGVDVLNMSFGPGVTEADPWYENHLYAKAFLNAAAAGVSSSISAGNSGPGLGTTASIAPWMPATAASTHNRVVLNTVGSFSGGATAPPSDMVGKGMTAGYGPVPIVSAVGRLKADGTPDDGRCLEEFPAGTFNGEIVVCVRGVIARVTKGANVLAGGAGGMVLANSSAEGASTSGDAHVLPAVNITSSDAALLAAWMSSGQGHFAAISGMEFSRSDANGDILASFSSRGPTWMATCCLRPTDIVDWETGGFFGRRMVDVLKPNVTAPGVDIWAAWATDPNDPSPLPEYIAISGTSMASPHHAGAMALIKAVHPDWSPAEIESAFMTTAVTEGVRKQDGVTPATPFDVGAGRIDVAAAASAGFLLDESTTAMAAASPMAGGDPSALNLAALAEFSCLATCSWTRTLKGEHEHEVQWTASASSDTGLELTVEPAAFGLAAGELVTVTVTASVEGMAKNATAFGRVDFAPDNTDVPAAHMPVAVRAVEVDLPPAVISEDPVRVVLNATGPTGTAVLPGWRMRGSDGLQFVSGELGLTSQATFELSADADADPFGGGPATATAVFTAPAHAGRIGAEIRRSEAADVSLYMGRDVNRDGAAQEDEVLCASAGAAWTEMCNLADEDPTGPEPYWVLVHSVGASSEGAVDSVDVRFGQSGVNPANSLVVSGPSSVQTGMPFDIHLDWTLEQMPPGGVAYGSFNMLGDGGQVIESVEVDLVRGFMTSSIFLPDVRTQQ